MRLYRPNLIFAGLLFGAGYWLFESLLHTYVFDSGSLAETLICENDPNELWMRSIVTLLFAAFGWASQRRVQVERTEKERAEKLNRLYQYIHQVSRHLGKRYQHFSPASFVKRDGNDELTVDEDAVEKIVQAVHSLSEYLEFRVDELYSLLELTHEINKGVLVEDILQRMYDTFRPVIPYNRIGIALLQDNGANLAVRWVRADDDTRALVPGYSAPMAGSSLQQIINTGEPRIINDLAKYLSEHPNSTSTKLILEEGIRSSLTCPLVTAGKSLGFIFFSSCQPGTYKNAHSEIFKMIAGQLSIVIEKSQVYERVIKERETSESLLLNVMPARIIASIKAGNPNPVESLPQVGVLFADIVGFSEIARTHPAESVLDFLREVFTHFDHLCETHSVEKIKTIGDAYMVSSGGVAANSHGLINLAHFALDMLAVAPTLHYPDGRPLNIRVGLHIGPVIAGVISQKKFAYDLWGDTVNIAQRLESTGIPGHVLVTEYVHTLLKDYFQFEARGEIELKGEGRINTYYLKEVK